MEGTVLKIAWQGGGGDRDKNRRGEVRGERRREQ